MQTKQKRKQTPPKEKKNKKIEVTLTLNSPVGNPIESPVAADGTTLTGDGTLTEDPILVPKYGKGSTLLLLLLLRLLLLPLLRLLLLPLLRLLLLFPILLFLGELDELQGVWAWVLLKGGERSRMGVVEVQLF